MSNNLLFSRGVSPQQLRYAKSVHLQRMTDISARKFSEWTTSNLTMSLEIAETIAAQQGIPLAELPDAWSVRRQDVALMKAAQAELELILEQRHILHLHRYRQLTLEDEMKQPSCLAD